VKQPRSARSRTERRLRAQITEQTTTIKLLRDEFGSLLDLVPLVNLTEGIDHETIRWLMQGQFLPHIAQLMTTTLEAFGAYNACEWTLNGDPRGQFLLTIQRKEGKSTMELRAEAEDQTQLLRTRLVELIRELREAFDAYMDSTGTLEGLLDVIHRGVRAAEAPLGIAIADINAAAWNRLRREDRAYLGLAPELLPQVVGQLLDERRAARTLLDRQEIATAMLRAPHFSDLYMAYKHIRGNRDNKQETQDQEADPAAQAGSGHD